jgi:hypothetical protein
VKVRRAKPYVCVDCDFADHFRFQAAADLDAVAGAWLRCLAHSRAQEQDGIVKRTWLRRNFVDTFARIEELVAVGLLLPRSDGDYEIHAYAPRNQTRAMLEADRTSTRRRVRAWRREQAEVTASASDVTPYERASNAVTVTPYGSVTGHEIDPNDPRFADENRSVDGDFSETLAPPSMAASSGKRGDEKVHRDGQVDATSAIDSVPSGGEEDVTPYKRGCHALVPTSTSTSTSTSISISSSLSSSSDHDRAADLHSSPYVGGVQRGGRSPLPSSERALSGPAWLAAFTEGISAHTGRPCTAARVYLSTLERIVTDHAPLRDAPSACAWIRAQAQIFAKLWDGKYPGKGLTPDGFERWLTEGRRGPPEFGKPRTVQLSADEWHADDDLTDLGAEVVR